MAEFETVEGVLLRVVPYRDGDLIVTLMGEGIGKRAAFAGGARKSRKRFPGGLELFRRYRFSLRARRENSMPILSGIEILEDLPGMGESLERISCASCGLALVDRLTHEGEPEDGLNEKLWHFLTRLQALPADDLERMVLALRWFELHAMASQGILPYLTHCYRTGLPLSRIERPGFSVRGGGLIALEAAEGHDHVGSVEPALLVGLLRLLEAPSLDGLLERAAERRADGGDTLRVFSREAGRLLRALIEHHVNDGRIKAYDFLESLMNPPFG